ncbi:MAG TPA: hypothetical protein DEU95_13875 [Chloroflexi bacterium]|jgi:predicted transcriptional regulator|nr:hypothetical protein [Chloroflexota bacterium]
MKRSPGPTTYRGHRLQITIQVDPDQVAAVDRLAAFRRTSRTALVREALDLYLASGNSRIDTSDIDAERVA